MLIIEDLHAGYGQARVVQGASLQLAAGQVLALLGRNGCGRSTLIKAVMGLVHAHGSIVWRGQQLIGRPTYDIARLGVGLVPEERAVFADLTVADNLLLGRKPGQPAGHWDCAAVYELFAPLAVRARVRAGVLSGGEQQMLALGRTLMGNPELLLVDEPTEGLAPQWVQAVTQALLTIKAQGVTLVLIEQKLGLALRLADRCAVMGQGRIVFDATPQQLLQRPDVLSTWLQV